MTIKDQEKENRSRPRARRDNLDLRKKVLKDQTSKILNASPCRDVPVISKAPMKPKSSLANNSENVKSKLLFEDKTDKENVQRVSCEEKTLQIRRR